MTTSSIWLDFSDLAPGSEVDAVEILWVTGEVYRFESRGDDIWQCNDPGVGSGLCRWHDLAAHKAWRFTEVEGYLTARLLKRQVLMELLLLGRQDP